MPAKKGTSAEWYNVANADEISSPALLVYPDRVEANIRKMVEIAGGIARLRPHVKTHKMPEVIRLQVAHGITKFKCSIIAEAEMAAGNGAADIILAMQPVGPAIDRFFALKTKFPETIFSCICDNEAIIRQLAEKALKYGSETGIWLDINNGMNRTGIAPDDQAVALFELINNLPMVKNAGLHAYDGHIRDSDFSIRKKKSDDAFKSVTLLAEKLGKSSKQKIKIVAGGSPTFRVHAMREDVECSPGTVLLWDYGYSSALPDMEFSHAAVLMTRVVSKPAEGLLCLDLGHKAIGSEMPHPRIKLFDIEEYTAVNHSEEHLVIKTESAGKYNTGDVLYGIPFHICPTVDRHDLVYVVENNKATGVWSVDARKRFLTI
jgi:D-serine deaminase-like pyridoxal phosphate-dependent protein